MPRPKLPDTPEPATRTAAWRRGLIAKGGWRTPPVTLQPDDATKARALMGQRGIGFGELLKQLVRSAE